MALSLGIVGLPNVGKSTLFNALTKQTVLAANYPFATIDPNVGIVNVEDRRVFQIAEISKPKKIIPATVEFVDIAGLVKGASTGAGLGNKFLGHIKEVSAIIHLVRAFRNENITHVENSTNPKRDIELINTELILKDLETLENRINAIKSRSRFDKEISEQLDHFTQLVNFLGEGNLAIDQAKPTSESCRLARHNLFLLTDKPVIYLVNVELENSSSALDTIREIVGNKQVLTMDISLESDLAQMSEAERVEFMKELSITETGLSRLTKSAYKILGLISFFTEGPEEVRAWTIKKGWTAPEASSVIHTDFQKNFITMEVVKFEDFIKYGSWQKARENGKLFLGGKTYVVEDGDIVVVRHNG